MFYHHAGQYTVEEFNVALDEFRSNGKPRITTFFHELSVEEIADESVKGFMERLENEIQHYYSVFSSIDTVKLKILMELALNPDNGISLELSDCELRMNNSIITNIHMENLPIYKNHEDIIKVRNRIIELEKDVIKAKQLVIEHPDDVGIDDKYYETRMNLVKAKDQLHEYEKQLLDASFSIVARTINGKPYNNRTKDALTLFDLGYQIFTYVKNRTEQVKASGGEVSGMLLYAKTDENVTPNNNEYSMSGNKIKVHSLDLDRDFEDIKQELNEIADKCFCA